MLSEVLGSERLKADPRIFRDHGIAAAITEIAVFFSTITEIEKKPKITEIIIFW